MGNDKITFSSHKERERKAEDTNMKNIFSLPHPENLREKDCVESNLCPFS